MKRRFKDITFIQNLKYPCIFKNYIINVKYSKLGYVPATSYFCYIVVPYNTVLHTAPQRHGTNIAEPLNSQRHPTSRPTQAGSRVTLVRCSGWNYREISSAPQIARFTWPTWGPLGSCRPQVGPMWATWTLLSGAVFLCCLHNPTHPHWQLMDRHKSSLLS